MMYVTVGERIRERRIALNLTQDELAKKLGYTSRSSINKIEVDAQHLPQSKIQAIAKILNVTPAYLMGWEDENGKSLKAVDDDFKLTPFEKVLISTFRNADDFTQKMVIRNLNLDDEYEKRRSEQNFA